MPFWITYVLLHHLVIWLMPFWITYVLLHHLVISINNSSFIRLKILCIVQMSYFSVFVCQIYTHERREHYSQATYLVCFYFIHMPSENNCRWLKFLLFDWLIDDHLYSAILRSLEQTHCACLWFYMSDTLFIGRFLLLLFLNIHRSGVLKLWHGWCHMKLQPSRRKFCVHHTTMHHVTSCKATYVRCMRV